MIPLSAGDAVITKAGVGDLRRAFKRRLKADLAELDAGGHVMQADRFRRFAAADASAVREAANHKWFWVRKAMDRKIEEELDNLVMEVR